MQPRFGEMYVRKVILGKVPTLGCNPGISRPDVEISATVPVKKVCAPER